MYQAYSVYDRKAQAYATPFFLHRNEVAVRSFRDAVMDPKHPMAAHPEDYELHHVGSWDDNNGCFLDFGRPQFLCNGVGEPEATPYREGETDNG